MRGRVTYRLISTDLGLFANNMNFGEDAKVAFNNSFQGLWDYYFEKYSNPTPSVNSTSSSSRSSSHRANPIQGLLQKLRENPNKGAKSDRI